MFAPHVVRRRLGQQPTDHRPIMIFIFCLIAIFVTAAGQDSPQEGPSQVTVTLSSGRSFTAWIDERTNESTRWRRFQSPRVVIRRPIAWDRVESAQHRGETLSREQLQQLAPTIESKESDLPPGAVIREEVIPPDTAAIESQQPRR